ncbi:MAG: restriction endonuclease subunit S [Planctomycetes bacterium]|nr:restriction endonuclease subunit S [Planctomycetota bacterium]
MSKHWPRVPLGEVLTERQETPSDEDLLSGRVRIVAKIGFNDGKIQLRESVETKTKMILIRPGDFVVSGINAAKGAVAVYGEENPESIAATIHYGAYIPNKNRVNVSYLWWLLRSQTFRDLLSEYVPGGIKTELKAKRLLPIPIPLPSLLEQERIVSRIEEFKQRIEKALALQQAAFKEVEALIPATINSFLERLKSEEIAFKHFFCEPLLNGLSIPSGRNENGTPFLKVGSVNYGIFNPKEVKYVTIELPKSSHYWLIKGDFLISRGNSDKFVGNAAVYEGNPAPCAFPDLLIRARIDPKKGNPHFFVYAFRSANVRKYIESVISGTSSTMKKISQPKLEEMRVPNIGVEEQNRIVDYLNVSQMKINELTKLQAETISELNALLPSILDKAFKGEL